MEESKILALLDDKTNTTLFLLPALEIPDHILRQMGFVNAFLQDKDRFYPDGEIPIFALFKPKAKALFEAAIKDLEEEGILMDEYDYPDGHVVLVLRFPPQYKKDYDLFLKGKYSKFSSEFKKLFPEKKKSYVDGREGVDYSLHFHIFKRTPGIREFLEEDLGIEIDKNDPEFQYWTLPDQEGRETLSQDKLEKNENKVQV